MLVRRLNMCVVGDVEVDKKLSRSKGGQFTNFVATMNVFFTGRVAVSGCLKV